MLLACPNRWEHIEIILSQKLIERPISNEKNLVHWIYAGHDCKLSCEIKTLR